ncbi:fimbrial protein [Pseudomonas sp. RHF3.3-3]|uniref:fimbrial protein n=1 Tax=Pseudomonas sp. RHF3.3-3 TaxID=3396624 RepID=UPI003A853C42
MKAPIRSLAVLAASLTLSTQAQAVCDYYPNIRNSATFPSTITVPADLPVGRLIAQVSLSRPFPSGESRCSRSFPYQIVGRYAASDQVDLGGPRLMGYRTNVPGVAVLIRTRAPNFDLFRSVELHSSAGTETGLPWIIVHNLTDMEAHFYKIGNISTGTVPAGNLRQQYWSGRLIKTIALNNSVQFVVQSPTCDLAVGDVNRTINLDKIQLSNFTDNSAGKYNFEISANCNNASSVTFRFTGTPANGDSYRFANTGTAPGVGTWLYSRIGGVESTIRANGTENTRTVSVSANRAVLPLGAAYWKIGTPGKGTLVSAVTVNITYN